MVMTNTVGLLWHPWLHIVETSFAKSDADLRSYVFIPPFCQLVKLLNAHSFSSRSFWFLIRLVQAHFIPSHFQSFKRAWKYKCVNAVLFPSSVQQPNSVHKLKLGTEPTERHKLLNLNDLPDDLSLLIICLCTYEMWWGQILVITEMSVYSRCSKLFSPNWNDKMIF